MVIVDPEYDRYLEYLASGYCPIFVPMRDGRLYCAVVVPSEEQRRKINKSPNQWALQSVEAIREMSERSSS